MSDQQLAQSLAGNGVTISNVQVNCHSDSYGSFANNNTALEIDSGLVLSTGLISDIPNPAFSFSSTPMLTLGDQDLANTTGIPVDSIFDACSMEFDIEPLSDTLKFKYVFSSEEYHQWVCSNFNDAFAFLISGPDPSGGNYNNKNIALIPGSTQPVAINSVNNGVELFPGFGSGSPCTWGANSCPCNSQYFIDNEALNTDIAYNGLTVTFEAVIPVIPCNSYHLKLVIADVYDGYYDSGVFIEAGSIESSGVSLEAYNNVGGNYPDTIAIRSCVDAYIDFIIDDPIQNDQVLYFNIGGTAVNGVDYSTIPDSVIIPAGDTIAELLINPLPGGNGSPETIVIGLINLCSTTVYDSVVITILDSLPLAIIGPDTISYCQGGSAQLLATGSNNYTWSPSNGLSDPNIADPDVFTNTNTTYTVTTTLGSCTASDSVTVTIDSKLNLDLGFDHIGCSGNAFGTAWLNSTTGTQPFTLLWSTNENTDTINNLSAGTYTLTVTDAGGCEGIDSVTILQTSSINIDSITGNAISCYNGNDGSATVFYSDGTPPYQVVWNNQQTGNTANNLSAGIYTVNVTDSNGCNNSTSITIEQADSIEVAVNTTDVACSGSANGTAEANIIGQFPPYLIEWSNGDIGSIADGLSSGTHQLTVTDSNACSIVRSFNISDMNPILFNLSATDVSCAGRADGAALLSQVSGGTTPYQYEWSTSDTLNTIDSLSAGNYLVTITDDSGCFVIDSVIVDAPMPLDFTSDISDADCAGGDNGMASITASGGTAPYDFLWENGQTGNTITGLLAGEYPFTITDDNNCELVDTISIITTELTLDELTVNDESCPGEEDGAVFVSAAGGTEPYTYTLIGVDSLSEGVFTGLSGGATYQLQVTDAASCVFHQEIIINQSDEITVDFVEEELNIELGESIEIEPVILPEDNGTYNYIWEPSTGLNCTDCSTPIATPPGESIYQLTVYDSFGCAYSNEIKVNVEFPTAQVHLPNVFSPNNDGINDVVSIYGNTAKVKSIHLMIFDAWGEKIFDTRDLTTAIKGWDGTYKGQALSPGVYTYSLNTIFEHQIKADKKHGSITLIR
ncbi:MAG: choice-of-anchor L domain-containing protein [Chitinophagales bacterium]